MELPADLRKFDDQSGIVCRGRELGLRESGDCHGLCGLDDPEPPSLGVGRADGLECDLHLGYIAWRLQGFVSRSWVWVDLHQTSLTHQPTD